jgi:hypothetical protein
MKLKLFTTEHFLLLLAFLIGLGFRLLLLGSAPLSDSESNLAMQALEIARGNRVLLDPQPFYSLWTGSIFFLLGSSEFLARILPALAGSFLVFVPYLFRRQIGRNASLILAFVIALDAGFVAVSRTADSRIFAVLFGTLLGYFIIFKKPIGIGIFAGLVLLSGPTIWIGGLGLIVAWGLSRLAKRQADLSSPKPNEKPNNETDEFQKNRGNFWRTVIFWGVGTLVVAGTIFLRVPAGLSAMAASIPAFINGWIQRPAYYFTEFLIALSVYQILAIIMGIWGIVWGLINKEKVDLFLSLWTLTTLIIVILYPAGQIPDLIWVNIPLWVLGVRQINRWLGKINVQDLLTLSGQSAVTFVLLIFGFFNLMALLQTTELGTGQTLRWVSLGGAIVLIIIITILIAWGWSVKTAGNGLLCGVILLLVICSLSASWNAAGLGKRPDAELWRNSSYIQEEDLLATTLGDVSEWNTGHRLQIQVVVQNVESPAVRFMLRNYPKVEYSTTLLADSNPPVVITDKETQLPLVAQYTGQDFAWRQTPKWLLMAPLEWLRWAFYREVPTNSSTVILWVRSDMFPGSVKDGEVK